MATFSTELDPFITSLIAAAENGDFGPSFVLTNFKNQEQRDRALVQMACAEVVDAMADIASLEVSAINTATKFDGQKIVAEMQKGTYLTGTKKGQAPYAVQH